MALIAASCGGSSDGASGTTAPAGSSNGGDSGATGGDDGPTEPTGTLRIGAATNVQSLDAQMASVAQEYYLRPIYDSLIQADVDGSYIPSLAEDWEFLDRTTFELTLREDLVFSDGTPLDAEAVVANFDRGRSLEASPSAAFYGTITDVVAIDDLTVQISLERPTTALLDELSRLPGMMMSPASFDGDPGVTPIGAGGWVHDADASNVGDVVVYQANPNYWNPSAVKVATVEIRFLEADAAFNAITSGQIDVVELRNEADAENLEASGLELVTRPGANVYYLQFTDTDGTLLEPLGDVRVRQALAMAIDREGFMQSIQFGRGDASASFWLADTPFYDASVESLAYDPDAAKALLAEAGYPDGFSVAMPTFGGLTTMAEAVQQMWAAVGIDATIDQVEPGTLAAVMRSGTVPVTPTLARGSTAESHYMERLASGGPYDPLGTDRGELDALAELAFEAETLEDQQDAWREMYRYAVAEGYMIVIGHQIPTIVVSSNVDGAVLRPYDNLPQPIGVSVGS